MMNEREKLPEGWKRVKLGEVLKYEQPTKYLVKSENYDKKHGIPVLTPGKTFILGYTEETFGVFENVPAIIFDDFTTESKYIPFPFKLKSSAVKILKTKNEENNLYIIYNIIQILNFKPGSEHKRFWISEFSKIEISLPPLPEQQKIAEILETVDKAIEKTERIIEKYKRIKQGLMQDLLTRGIDEKGQIRDEKAHKFKDSPIGRIPEEWEVVRLGDEKIISKMKSGGTPLTTKKEYWENGEIHFVKIEDITKTNKYIYKTDTKITILGLNNSSAWIVPPNSLLLSMYASFGEVAINKIPVAINQAIIAIIPQKTELDLEYLYYTLTNSKKSWWTYLRETTQKNLNAEIVKNFTILLPPLSEQQRIASILSQIDEVIEKETKYKEKLERIKQGLMEDLLTGKVRVNKLIDEVENE